MTIAEARPGEAAPAVDPAMGMADPGQGPLEAVTRSVPVLDPVTLVRAALASGLETAAFLRPSEGLAMVGIGRAWATETAGEDRFRVAESAWAAAAAALGATDDGAATGPVLLGGLGFLGDRATEPGPWAAFPPASLVLPALLLRLRAGEATLTACGRAGTRDERAVTWDRLAMQVQAGRPPGRAGAPAALTGLPRSMPDRQGWDRLVGLMSGAVGRGRLDKVVLARRVDLELANPADPASVLGALAEAAPESAAFLFARGGAAFVGATPERLVRVEGRAFRTVAIAGSARRGADATEDAALAAGLLASDKDREEHAIVVDALRARLSPLATELRVAPVPGVLPLRDLQHLVTPFEGSLRERAGLLALAGLLHPTPAVGGSPAEAALAMIAEHEGYDRGWYAGPVGWVGADGDGELMVGLRSGVLEGRRATLFAGCGIVADSDPAREWAESRMKLRPMLAALGLDPDDRESVP